MSRSNGEEGVLVAVDGSEATDRTVRYVARFLACHTNYHVRLLHLLPAIPPACLEHKGGDSPEELRTLDDRVRRACAEWIEQESEKARPVIDKALKLMKECGVPAEKIEVDCRPSVTKVTVARDCLAAAQESDCKTIAVGRGALPWLRERFHHHPADELVRHGHGYTIWVVE